MPDYEIEFKLIRLVWSSWIIMQATAVVSGKTYLIQNGMPYSTWIEKMTGSDPEFASRWCSEAPMLIAYLIAADMTPQLPEAISLATPEELDWS